MCQAFLYGFLVGIIYQPLPIYVYFGLTLLGFALLPAAKRIDAVLHRC